MVKNQRFCPNCGSEEVEPDFRRTNVLGEMIFNQNKWYCKECGYTGLMPQGDPDQEFEEGEEEIEFEEVEQETIDPEAGSAYFRYYLTILLPATILFVIILLLLLSL
jgi:ribosomal protein S27AE